MSVITIIYALLMPVISKRYAAKWRYIIWLVIAIGWLIPFRPNIEVPILPAQSIELQSLSMQEEPTSYMPLTETMISDETQEAVRNSIKISFWSSIVFVWIAGVIIVTIYHILRHRNFMKVVNRWSRQVTSPEELEQIHLIKRDLKIKANIDYKTCDSISSPMLVGLFQPVILVPQVTLSKNELGLILKHELIHYKRHDLWYKALILIVSILHWFNPIVYIMSKSASTQCEISCDDFVLQNADSNTRRLYGETIIAIVRNASIVKTSLSTNFYGGKSGMKHRIISILDVNRKKAGIILLCVFVSVILLTGATFISAENKLTFPANTEFTKEEYKKLLTLQFKGYEKMSVEEFQEKVWKAIDNEEYMELLERFTNNEQLEKMKDSNEIAYFLFYILEPLTAQDWKLREFRDEIITDFASGNNAQFEYQSSFSILDADHLTVSEYDNARRGMQEGLKTLLQQKMEEELQNEQVMEQEIQDKITKLKKQWNTNSLQIDVQYFYIPLLESESAQLIEENQTEVIQSMKNSIKDYEKFGLSVNANGMMYFKGAPVRELYDSVSGNFITSNLGIDYAEGTVDVLPIYENGVLTGLRMSSQKEYEDRSAERVSNNDKERKEDYTSLLKLKTKGYRERTVEDFNLDLLKWANDDYDRMERINYEIGMNDFEPSLSKEDISFVALTIRNSSAENGAQLKSLLSSTYNEESKADPYFSITLSEKDLKQKDQIKAWCSMNYQLSYHIADDTKLTVGERDRCIGGVIQEIQKYWDETKVETFLSLEKKDLIESLSRIAENYSNESIMISIPNEQVQFEKLDERKL
jgi:beta-lactamase regulating signal transducer with metallopeptidase domain